MPELCIDRGRPFERKAGQARGVYAPRRLRSESLRMRGEEGSDVTGPTENR
jgi:hypothetical protein